MPHLLLSPIILPRAFLIVLVAQSEYTHSYRRWEGQLFASVVRRHGTKSDLSVTWFKLEFESSVFG